MKPIAYLHWILEAIFQKYFNANEFLVYYLNRGVRPVFVIPHEKVREEVEEFIGEDASIVFITTPGQVWLIPFI